MTNFKVPPTSSEVKFAFLTQMVDGREGMRNRGLVGQGLRDVLARIERSSGEVEAVEGAEEHSF
jgi:hypothetical protein